MKMASAFSELNPLTLVVTQKPIRSFFGSRYPYEHHYGLSQRVKILPIPGPGYDGPNGYSFVYCRRYDRRVSALIKVLKPKRFFTRSPEVALRVGAAGIPTILETHMAPENERFPMVKQFLSQPGAVSLVTVTEELKAKYVEAGIPESDTFSLADAVDARVFDNLPSKNELRSQLGYSFEQYIACYAGQLYHGRGIEVILEAARLLPEVDFRLIGGKPDDVRKWRVQAAKSQNVQLLGFIPNGEVPEYLSMSDVLLMPHTEDCSIIKWTSPLKLFEYLASGTPMIASDFPAFRRHLEDEENALLVPPGDPSELASAIKELKSDSPSAERIAKRARESVQSYSWLARAERIWNMWG